MLKSRKHVFWEALIVTIVFFLIGFFLGALFETNTSSKINDLYLESEVRLVDGMANTLLSEAYKIDCDAIKEENIVFANKVYEEAKLLEEFEESKTLTKSSAILHKKYDLLRTLLWMSNQDSLRRCDNYDLIVYLYEYESEDNEVKATQNVWSKVLSEVREINHDVLLIPIAADQELTSLNILMREFNITRLPAVVVNNQDVLYDLEQVVELRNKI